MQAVEAGNDDWRLQKSRSELGYYVASSQL